MEAWASSLIVGVLLAVSLTWLVSLINDRYIEREKYLSRIILKRAKKEEKLPFLGSEQLNLSPSCLIRRILDGFNEILSIAGIIRIFRLLCFKTVGKIGHVFPFTSHRWGLSDQDKMDS
jgi:hypothetical protein